MNKNLFYLIIGVIVLGVFMSSCSKNDIEEAASKKEECYEGYFVNSSEKTDFSNYEKIGSDEYENAISNAQAAYYQEYSIESCTNLQPINDYLSFMGKEEIDLLSYYKEGKEIVSNPDAKFESFLDFLVDNGLYSEEQQKMLLVLNNNINNAEDDRSYDNALLRFVGTVNSSKSLSSFEKFSLRTFGKVMLTEDSIVSRDKCKNCLKKHKWRILGWSLLFMLPLLIACIVATYGIGTVACIIAIIGTMKLTVIKYYCGSKCSWI